MVSLEQVKLLESKVSRTIEYVKKVSEEKAQLKEKLDSYQKRIEELEILIQRFKDDQSRIEDGILSALNRLNQFEDAVESRLSAGTTNVPVGTTNVPVGTTNVPVGTTNVPVEAKASAEKKFPVGAKAPAGSPIPPEASAPAKSKADPPEAAAPLKEELLDSGELDIF